MPAPDTVPPIGHLTITQAADQLGVKPWDVVRLLEADRLEQIVYVSAASLRAYAQETK